MTGPARDGIDRGDDGRPLRSVRLPDGDPFGFDIFADDGSIDGRKLTLLYEEAQKWPGEQREAMLNWLRSAETRARIRKLYRSPAELAHAVDPRYTITPALDVIGTAIEKVLRSKRPLNLMITMPPQEGKSTTAAIWTPIRALQLDPNCKIILSTYGDALAEAHSAACRNLIKAFGTGVTDPLTGLPVDDKLGLRLAAGQNKVSEWKIEGGSGGMAAVGIGSAITGRGADLFLIDDPFKNMIEADSARHRQKVDEWFSSVVLTRLSPSASIILIQTRWHPEDLAGKVLAAERELPPEMRTWRHINIPAIAEVGIPDALGREPGEPMVSARDTPEAKRDFATTRRKVGERTWYALYQGNPTNPAGGLFLRKWFDNRVEVMPEHPVASVVGVDPADSGEGDETGIIGATLAPDGTVILAEDWSEQMTSDEWSRQAVKLALMMGAREIALEAYTTATTYEQVIKRAYRAMHREAVEKHRAGALLTPVEQRCLTEVPPFTVYKWRAKGDAVGRSSLLRQALETGRARTVDTKLAVFEAQACDWQAGQHQPDRVAAAIIAHDRLAALGSGQATFATPTTSVIGVTPPAWMRRRIG
ncbi:terminase [Mycobacterium phage Thonko]|uniref:Terminase n=1 Tax=Mycobacterium phage Thonko TaxID=2282910 RepID=A0A346FC48_9CAUD|nr:terminase large subunit [Mycobacterium phage Thonko]AXN53273.1 terminase [Mycobacterium phage Thonko]